MSSKVLCGAWRGVDCAPELAQGGLAEVDGALPVNWICNLLEIWLPEMFLLVDRMYAIFHLPKFTQIERLFSNKKSFI